MFEAFREALESGITRDKRDKGPGVNTYVSLSGDVLCISQTRRASHEIRVGLFLHRSRFLDVSRREGASRQGRDVKESGRGDRLIEDEAVSGISTYTRECLVACVGGGRRVGKVGRPLTGVETECGDGGGQIIVKTNAREGFARGIRRGGGRLCDARLLHWNPQIMAMSCGLSAPSSARFVVDGVFRRDETVCLSRGSLPFVSSAGSAAAVGADFFFFPEEPGMYQAMYRRHKSIRLL